MKIVEIIGNNRTETAFRRVGTRAVIVNDGKVLMSNEVNLDQIATPGGGVEEGETLEQCLVREVAEETGLVVAPTKHFMTLREFYRDCLFVHHFFEAELTGETVERRPTPAEISNGMIPEWVPLNDALDRFSRYDILTGVSDDKRGLYLREYHGLKEYLSGEKSAHTVADLYGRGQDGSFKYKRRTARGAILYDGDILMSHETDIDQWLFPGGGIEEGETPEECCAREILEETGLIVEVGELFAEVNEYYGDTKGEHKYYICRVTGQGEMSLTEREKQAGTRADRIPLEKLLAVLKRDAEGDEHEENFRIHRREYHALCALMRRDHM